MFAAEDGVPWASVPFAAIAASLQVGAGPKMPGKRHR